MQRYLHSWLATAGLSALSIFLPPNAWANDAAKAGATMTVNVEIVTKEQHKTMTMTTVIDRVLKGRCLMEALMPTQIGWNGRTPEQEAALEQSRASGEAFAKQYGPSEELTNQIAAEAEKCGDDQACMMAMAQKLAQNGEIQNMAKNKDAAIAAASKLQPDLGPPRYQQWQPKQCSGTITANDTIVVDDPGGEGGMDAFKETKKIQGAAPTDSSWRGMSIETDLVAGTTSYRMAPVPPVTIASSSTAKGTGKEQVSLINDTKLPDEIGPLKGVLGSQSTMLKGETGTLNLSWQSAH